MSPEFYAALLFIGAVAVSITALRERNASTPPLPKYAEYIAPPPAPTTFSCETYELPQRGETAA